MNNIIENVLRKAKVLYSNLKVWRNSCVTFVLFMIIGFVVGAVSEIEFSNGFVFNNEFFLFILALLIFIISIIYCYIRYRCNKNGKYIEVDKISLKIIYYSLTFFVFSIYYMMQKSKFMNSYKNNIFGINQEQYIFCVNIFGYLIVATILFAILFNKYSMKKISKDGIELEEKVITNEQNYLITLYSKVINNFSDVICDVDTKMKEMDSHGFIRDDYTVDEYIIFIQEFVDLIMAEDSNISIIIKSYDAFSGFASKELLYNKFIIKKIEANIAKNKVFAYEKNIFVQYDSQVVKNQIVFSINCSVNYPGDLGSLLYDYIVFIETIYLKLFKANKYEMLYKNLLTSN